MAHDRTHYEILGIDRTADAAAIRRAWKVLIQVWHPDRFTGEMAEEAEAMTARINEAYQALRSEPSRSRYDARIDAEAGTGARDGDRAPRQRAPFSGTTPFATGTPRRATAPVQVASPPPTLVEAAARFGADVADAARRYPRVTVAVAVVWMLVFGSAAVSAITAGPRPPAAYQASLASYAAPATIDDPAADLEFSDPTPSTSLVLPDETPTAVTPRQAQKPPAGRGARTAPRANTAPGAGGATAGDPRLYAEPAPFPPPRRIIRITPRKR